MTEEETNLKEDVKKIGAKLDDLLASGKIKGFKIKKTPSRSQIKKNYVQVMYIQENRAVKTMKVPVEEGTVAIEGAPRLATSDYVLNYEGKPMIIIDALSSEPYNPIKNLEQATRDKMLAAGYRLLANRVELGEIKPKRKLSGALIFFGIIGLIVVGYLLLKK